MAESSPAILGSTLLSLAHQHTLLTPNPTPTGCAALDSALKGGFRYSEISSIAGSPGMGKTLITLHAVASHLLAHPGRPVAFIDTSGCSPAALRDVIVLHLRCLGGTKARFREEGYMYEAVVEVGTRKSAEELLEEATGILDRVLWMRVFDFAGVVEAVREVGEICGEREKEREREDLVRGHDGGSAGEVCEIADSEDEGLEIGFESQVEGEGKSGADLTLQDGGIGMVVVDNVGTAMGSLMSSNQTQAQALLTTFLRTLQHLTTAHQICTILINTAVGTNLSATSTFARRLDDQASIFSATPGKPALGRTYAHLIDTSIFVSKIPKTKEDAEMAYGGEETAGWKTVGILEVLKDRCGGRQGRWAAFEAVDGLELNGYE